MPALTPYKMDIQQGNVVTQEMVAKLKPGMTPSQVRFILGTPLVVDAFHKDRWDYVYRFSKRGTLQEHRRIVIVFQDDKLARIEGDVVPAKPGSDGCRGHDRAGSRQARRAREAGAAAQARPEAATPPQTGGVGAERGAGCAAASAQADKPQPEKPKEEQPKEERGRMLDKLESERMMTGEVSGMVHAMNIAIAGASGRMGRTLIETVLQAADMKLAAALEQKGNAHVGKDAGELAGAPCGVKVTDDVAAAIRGCDVLIDFTRPEGTLAHLAACRKAGREAGDRHDRLLRRAAARTSRKPRATSRSPWRRTSASA